MGSDAAAHTLSSSFQDGPKGQARVVHNHIAVAAGPYSRKEGIRRATFLLGRIVQGPSASGVRRPGSRAPEMMGMVDYVLLPATLATTGSTSFAARSGVSSFQRTEPNGRSSMRRMRTGSGPM